MADQPSSPPLHSRFETLDGLRGVAAVCVMLHHYAGDAPYYLLKNANIAVDFFFILSGFVIAHSYGNRLQTGAMNAFEYISKRFIRLYPMYIAGLLIGLLAFSCQQKAGIYDCPRSFITSSFLLNFFYLPAFNDYELKDAATGDLGRSGVLFPSNPPAWSLFFEVVASLAFLLLVRLNRRNLTLTVILSFALLALYGIYHAHAENRFAVDLEMGWGKDNFLCGFPRVIFGFSYGILLYYLVHDERFRAPRSLAGRFIKSSFLLYVIVVLLFIFPKLIYGLYPAFVLVIAAPFLVYAGSIVSDLGAFELNTAKFLGWISYPVYCLHLPIANLVGVTMRGSHYSQQTVILVSLSLTLAASVLLTRFYEEPTRAYFSRKLSSLLRTSRREI